MKIVVLASRFPYPLERGDKLRLYQQIKELATKHEIILFACHDHEIKSEWYDEMKKYCTTIYTHHFSLIAKISGLFYALIKGLPFQCGQVYSTQFRNKMELYCHKNPDSIVFCQLIRMAPYCENISNKKYLDYMDAFSLSMKKRADISPFPLSVLYHWESRRVKEYELRLKKNFNKLIAITAKDAEVLEIISNDKCEIIANNIDLEYFYNDNKINPTFDIGFIGNLGYLPNEEAVSFIVKSILPSYEKQFNKKLTLLIAGARPTDKISSMKNDNIEIWNDLEDIRDAYKEIKILVAPIKSGTGQQNKVLEAMAMEVPVITTEEVANGINIGDINCVIKASTENEFINAIHLLLNNSTNYNAQNISAKSFIDKSFTKNRITEIFQ